MSVNWKDKFVIATAVVMNILFFNQLLSLISIELICVIES